jgi:hypothetical protein
MIKIERSKERIIETNEVFSSSELVEKMFSLWPKEVWSDPEGKWVEPTCGEGNILIAMYNNLMNGLKDWEPDSNKRHKHIIENMIFGVDIMEDNIEHCIDRLNARGLNHNLVCADALTYDFSFGKVETDGAFEYTPVSVPVKVEKKDKKKSELTDLTGLLE